MLTKTIIAAAAASIVLAGGDSWTAAMQDSRTRSDPVAPPELVWRTGNARDVVVTFKTFRLGPCQVTFRGLFTGTTLTKAQLNEAQANFNTAKAALKKAHAKSSDMRRKMKEACKKHAGKVTIDLLHDFPTVFLAVANSENPRTALIGLDMTDINDIAVGTTIGNAMVMGGPPRDPSRVKDQLLTRLLAHEFDHNRDAAGAKKPAHKDPTGDDAYKKSGPAVDDANRVVKQVFGGFAPQRTHYADKDNFGLPVMKFDSGVFYKTWLHAGLRGQQAAVGKEFVPFTVDTGTIPNQPCGGGDCACYPPIIQSDRDLDGVLNADDNCPDTPNPQQGLDCEQTVSALSLDFAHGSLAAGALVPLRCVVGGTTTDPDTDFCNCTHIHNTISITGILGSFSDQGRNCGHGCTVTAKESDLDHTC